MAGIRSHRLVDSVVIGYDGSGASQRAVARGTAVAEPGGRVVLVTASLSADGLIVEEDAAAPERPTPDELVDEAVRLCAGRGVNVATRIEQSEPVEALVDVARDIGADLIVVGARGDSFVARALRGSVGERLFARAPCDVLVVR